MSKKLSMILVLCFILNLLLASAVLAAEDKEPDEKVNYEKLQEECLNYHKNQTEQEIKVDNDSLTDIQNTLIEKSSKPNDAKNLMENDVIYEVEPNYPESCANRIYLDYDVVGKFTSIYDLDYYKLTVNQAGNLELFGIAGHSPYWFYGDYFAIGLYDSNDECLNWSHTVYVSSNPCQVLEEYVTPGTYYIHLMTYNSSNPYSSMCVGEFYCFGASMPDVVATTPVSSVSLNKCNIELNVGDSENLVATIYPSDATNQSLSWSSSNSSVAEVNSSGLIDAVGVGSATITVTTEDGNKTANCFVTVNEANIAVNNITLNRTSLTIEKGNTTTLTAIIYPSNASNQSLAWHSTDTSVATVNNGQVTAVAEGTATIIVITADGGKNASCTVTVSEATSGQGDWEVWEEIIDVPADKLWTIQFNKTVQTSTINSNNIFVTTDTAGNNKVTGVTVVPNSSDSTYALVIPPTGKWQFGETYYLFITTGIKSANGTALNNGVKMRFTTKSNTTNTATADVTVSGLGFKQITVNSTTVPGGVKYKVEGFDTIADLGTPITILSSSDTVEVTIIAADGSTELATGNLSIDFTNSCIEFEVNVLNI